MAANSSLGRFAMTPFILAAVAALHLSAPSHDASACFGPIVPSLDGMINVRSYELRPDGRMLNGLEPADPNQG